jgi:hypothetical protein
MIPRDSRLTRHPDCLTGGVHLIITFLDQRRIVLNALFGCTLKRAPSLNALRHVLHALDDEALEQAFRRHARDLLPPEEAGLVHGCCGCPRG